MYFIINQLFEFFGLNETGFLTVADFIPWLLKVGVSIVIVWFVFRMIREAIATIGSRRF